MTYDHNEHIKLWLKSGFALWLKREQWVCTKPEYGGCPDDLRHDKRTKVRAELDKLAKRWEHETKVGPRVIAYFGGKRYEAKSMEALKAEMAATHSCEGLAR